uniref:LOG family protein n=1 Tax=Thermofilum pendens TaxID=2269 RepID=A0A7C4FBS0_THEPE
MRVLGVAALGTEPPPELVAKAKVFVEELSSACGRGLCLALGGYWGLMRVVVDEALRHGLCVLLFPPAEREDFDYPEGALVVRTGTSYRVRSIFLCRSSDVLVCLGGEAGTMQEVFTAYLEGTPVLVLGGTGLATDVLEQLAPCLDTRCTSEVVVVRDPRELARKACELLSKSPGRCVRGLG